MKKASAIASTLTGSLMLIAAVALSGDAIERALTGNEPRELFWGPALFRSLLAIHGLILLLVPTVWKRSLRADGSSSSQMDGDQAGEPFPWITMVGLSLLALGLRLPGLDSDLWVDEVLTLTDFVRPSLGEIVTSFPSQNQHMLYSILARASVLIFGESAWALRLPSVLFGVGSLWALYLLGRRITGRREALLACALMTVSYHHIWFSQNARGYMGLLFFSILVTWLWIEAQSHDDWRWWIGYSITVSLGMWIHMTMAFVVMTHALLFVFSFAARLRREGLSAIRWEKSFYLRPITAWFLSATITLQLYALSLPEFLRTGLHEVSLPSEWTNPLWVITESIRSLQIGFSGAAVLLGGAAMVLAGWLSITRRNLFAGFAIAMPALLAAVIMLLLGHNLWPRFFFFSMGFALLIVVEGAMAVARLFFDRRGSRRLPGRVAGPALAGLMILASAATVPRCYALPKQDFSGARDYVEGQRKSREPVIAVGLAGLVYGRYFAPDWLIAQTRAEFDAARSDHSDIWLVYTLPIEVRAYRPEIWEAIEKEFKVVKVFPGTLGGGEVYVLKSERQLSRSGEIQ
jgi:hypothetical protein